MGCCTSREEEEEEEEEGETKRKAAIHLGIDLGTTCAAPSRANTACGGPGVPCGRYAVATLYGADQPPGRGRA